MGHGRRSLTGCAVWFVKPKDVTWIRPVRSSMPAVCAARRRSVVRPGAPCDDASRTGETTHDSTRPDQPDAPDVSPRTIPTWTFSRSSRQSPRRPRHRRGPPTRHPSHSQISVPFLGEAALRSATTTAGGVDARASKRHLLAVPKRLDVRGRSKMTKAELVEAINNPLSQGPQDRHRGDVYRRHDHDRHERSGLRRQSTGDLELRTPAHRPDQN